MSHGWYTAQDLADALGVTVQCIRQKLRKKFPNRCESWWRFTKSEYEQLVKELAQQVSVRGRVAQES